MHKKNITQLVVGAIETNCWICPINEQDTAIIDPGDEADRIISVLKKLKLTPKFILLTHGHFDHITAVPELVSAYSSENPVIAIHRLDSQYLGPDSYTPHSISAKAAMGNSSLIDALWPASRQGMPPPGRLLEEGDTIGPFTVLHLPGHTPGSVAYWDKAEGILFTGDTLFAGTYGRTDLPGGNEQEMVSSLRRLFAMDTDIKVYPGHGETTTIGQEEG